MPLTEKQKQLAEANHNLVYEFLNTNNLPESQYYDVIIFGFLCAAQEYCENPKLQKYSFSTVAWRQMNQELFKHRKYLERKKKSAQQSIASCCEKKFAYSPEFQYLFLYSLGVIPFFFLKVSAKYLELKKPTFSAIT